MISHSELQTAQERSLSFRLQAVRGFEENRSFDPGDIFGLGKKASPETSKKMLQIRAWTWQALLRQEEEPVSQTQKATLLAVFGLYAHQIFSERQVEKENMAQEMTGKQDVEAPLEAYLSVVENKKILQTIYDEWKKGESPIPLSPILLLARVEYEKMKEDQSVQNPHTVASLTALFIHNDILRALNGATPEGSIDAHANRRVLEWVEAPTMKKYPRELRGRKGILRKNQFPVGRFENVFQSSDMKSMLDIPTIPVPNIQTPLESAIILDDILVQIMASLDEPADIEDAVLLRRAVEYGVIAHVFEKAMVGGKRPEEVIAIAHGKIAELMAKTHIDAIRERMEAKNKAEKDKLQKRQEGWGKLKEIGLNIITLGLHSLIPVKGKNIIWKVALAALIAGGLVLPGRGGDKD